MANSDLQIEGGKQNPWLAYALVTAVGAIGLLMMHHPMLLSGLRLMQIDLGDTRFINYILEHNYLWYQGAPGHRSFWDPPFFHPARNIAAYSDTMLGIAPLYAAFRVVGFPPDTAFQLWMLSLSVLNYGVMLHFLRKRVGLSIVGSSAGAFLFAFGAPRANMMVQQTQMTQFLSLISIDALFGLFAGQIRSRSGRAAAWIVVAAGLLAQLSSGFYPGWFTLLAVGVTAILALWLPTTRWPFLRILRRDAPWIAIAAGLGAIAIRPWLAHHLAAARELGPRWFQWVWRAMPLPTSWLDTGPWNWIGGWWTSLTGLHGFRSTEHSMPLGIGLATTAVVLAGLYQGRQRVSTRLLAMAGLVVALCLTRLPTWLVNPVKCGLILGPMAFAYIRRVDQPRTVILMVGLVVSLLVLSRFPDEFLLGGGLGALLIASLAFVHRRGDRQETLVLGVLIAGLASILFHSPVVMGIAAAVAALLAAATALLGLRSRRLIETVALGTFFCFCIPITFDERPVVWMVALAGPITILGARLVPVRPASEAIIHFMLAGVAVNILFVGGGAAWVYFFNYVPGASSMIFVSRVGLILLIPAAVGLGYAIDTLLARRKKAIAVVVGLVCILEQGGKSIAFDKGANRQAVAALAGRIESGSDVFYYTPDDPMAPVQANLDAMWAGLKRGKPTINGYSGHTPRGWRAIDEPPGFAPADLPKLVTAMAKWRTSSGRSVPSVQWIGGPSERPGRFSERKSNAGAEATKATVNP